MHKFATRRKKAKGNKGESAPIDSDSLALQDTVFFFDIKVYNLQCILNLSNLEVVT
jgi:hypothetical protein